MKKTILPLILLLAFPVVVHAHGGGLDAYGCHHDRKGEFAGQEFASQSEMLREKRKAAQDKGDSGEAKPKSKAKSKSDHAADAWQGRVVSVQDGDTITVLIADKVYLVKQYYDVQF